MEWIKNKIKQNEKEIRLIEKLLNLKSRGNIANVVSGNDCPRKTLCMCELAALQMYEGKGRKMIVPKGCNPFS